MSSNLSEGIIQLKEKIMRITKELEVLGVDMSFLEEEMMVGNEEQKKVRK